MYSIGVREARRRTCDCMPRGEDVEPGRKRGRGTGKRKKKKKRGGGKEGKGSRTQVGVGSVCKPRTAKATCLLAFSPPLSSPLLLSTPAIRNVPYEIEITRW